MVKRNDRWSALSMKERADLIKLYVSNGITSLNDIKKDYNSFAPGGPIKTDEYGYPADITPAVVEADYPREAEVWKRADASNADIVQRLKQGPSRITIQDWEDPKKVATHKMMSAGKYAVGNVQNINGQLFDFTDPKYGFKDPDRAAIDSAIKRGDYVEFDTEGDARYFAEHYKKHYNSFGKGGPTREMTPSEAAALNKTLNNSQYMLAVGDSPDDPAYLSTDVLEPAVVKAFNSAEEYNRYQGKQFGKQIAKKRDKVANNIMRALEYTPFIGDGVDVANTIASINGGDYSQAAVLAGLALLPNVIEKPLKGAKKIGRSITHAFSSDYLPTILSDKFGKGVINPSMAVSPINKTFDNLYGDIVLVGDKTLLDDSFLFRGDGDTSAVGWFTDAYDEVRDVHKVSSQMRAHDVNSPVPQLTKERFLELEAHPEYHEAKRNRITGLNEFKHALVPEELIQNQEMLEYLNEMEIPYSSYSEGNKVQAINTFLEEHPELLFKCGGKLNKN